MILQAERTKINNELTKIDAEISQLQLQLEIRRQSLEVLETAESSALEALGNLKLVLTTISEVSPDAIASLKSAVLGIFPNDVSDSGGNIPTEPTPPVNPNSGEPLLVLDGSVCEFASPICCLLEDCPESSLIGQSYELCSLIKDKPEPFVELVTHPENEHVAYQRKRDGEIICTYFGFSSKKIARSWKEFIEAIAFSVELRQAQRMTDCRWELKVRGMAMNQIDRLAKNCDFSKAYQPQPVQQTPAQAAGIEPPGAWGKVGKTPILEEGDICQVLEGQFKDQQGAVCSVSRFSEKPIGLQLPNGTIRYFYRTELKLVSKGSGEPKPQKQQLQSGQVLMGSRVVTTGNYIGVARQVKEANAQRGTFDKLAAIELVKAGLTPEQALATATGQQDDASDF